jgi:hypothetical protein
LINALTLFRGEGFFRAQILDAGCLMLDGKM